jgi:homogentisate 1,2-dioxygenase
MNASIGLVLGAHDAKEGGLVPCGLSLHGMHSAHGRDVPGTGSAMAADLVAVKIDTALAFMFEARQLLRRTQYALAIPESRYV